MQDGAAVLEADKRARRGGERGAVVLCGARSRLM